MLGALQGSRLNAFRAGTRPGIYGMDFSVTVRRRHLYVDKTNRLRQIFASMWDAEQALAEL